MSNIIGIIATVEDDAYQGKAHKKVTLVDGQVLKVKYGREGALKAKWGLLEVGKAIKFTMMDYTKPDGVKIPFVFDIATVDSQLAPPQSDQKVLPEHQKEIDRAQESPPPAPQAVGMITKEIGDMVRTKYLKPLFGDEAYIELIKWYRGQVLAITRVPFDGAKLPTFGKPKTQEPEPFTEPEDIPF